MRNCLEILKKQKIWATIRYQNGDVTQGYIKDYDDMGFVFTMSIEEAGSTNKPHFTPWAAIKEITM